VAVRSLTLPVEGQPDAVTLAVVGEFDLGTADQLVARQSVLGFGGVLYMDSSGLFGLIKLDALANETRTRIEITVGALSDWSRPQQVWPRSSLSCPPPAGPTPPDQSAQQATPRSAQRSRFAVPVGK